MVLYDYKGPKFSKNFRNNGQEANLREFGKLYNRRDLLYIFIKNSEIISLYSFRIFTGISLRGTVLAKSRVLIPLNIS